MLDHRRISKNVRSCIAVILLLTLTACGAGNRAQVLDSGTVSTVSEIPAAPTNLAAVPGNAQASLTWSDVSTATSYNVLRSTVNGGPYTQVAAVTSPSMTDSTVTNGVTYYFVVTAVNTAGESPDSSQASVTPDPAISTPAVPMGLTAIAGDAQVALSWTASSGATSYKVQRAIASGGPYTQVAAPTTNTYVDTSLTNGTIYYYVVAAADSAGESGNSAQVSALPAAPTLVPTAPTGLSATPGNAQVTLSWSASAGAASYEVQRATTTGGPYTKVGTPTSTSYVDTGLSNGTTYYYVVSALDSAGSSVNSAQVNATPSTPILIPVTPTGLRATPGNAQVALSWSVSTGATSYRVERATTSGGPYAQVAAPTSNSYVDTSVANGTAYYYVVAAVDAAGESVPSSQVSAIPVAAPTVPAVPSNLQATAGNAQASLTWSASTGATSYAVSRATTSGGPYTQVATPTSASFVDTALTNGTVYYYVVSAINSVGESAHSAQASVTPAAPPPPPTTFGAWTDVTPAGANLNTVLDCGNYGTQSAQVDPANPSNVYTLFMCQGVWKSTDYGVTWTGPINTGTNGAVMGDCAGGITISPTSTSAVPTIYASCIRGNGIGFWSSVDGGVNWTRYFVAPSGTSRQDYYPPVVDPYDQKHLLMAGHEMDYLVESVDGGQNWTNVTVAAGMLENGGTGAIFFLNTGNAASTRGTWLWIAQQTGGIYGTWRTANGGSTWVQVDKNEHSHGASQIYQPDNNGVVYMAGAYSTLGWGVLRSTDFGQTWAHVGNTSSETVVWGTSENVYSMAGGPIGIGGVLDPTFELGAQPGTGIWAQPGTPSGLTQGSAQIAVLNDGLHNIFVGAMWNSGLWRYVEP